jgi:hypothetical protein
MDAVIELLQGPLWGRLVSVARILIQEEQVFPSTIRPMVRRRKEAHFAYLRRVRGIPPRGSALVLWAA